MEPGGASDPSGPTADGFVHSVAGFCANLFRTAYFYLVIVLLTGVLGYLLAIPAGLVQRLFRRRGGHLAHTVIHHGARITSLPWRLTAPVVLDGRHRVAEGAAVVVCNHHSFIDIYLLFHLFPRIRMTARPTLFWIPFLGWAMSILGHIPHDPDRPREALERAAWHLGRDTFVGFFPEGTRAPSGHIGPFHRGAFRLAQETTELVQPVVVVGTGRVWAKNQLWIRQLGPVIMRVLAPVPVPRESSRAELRTIVERTREVMLAEHARLEAELLELRHPAPR